MRYKTIIEVITEADSASEALDIAGEFLRGNLETGVKMKCRTRAVKKEMLVKTCTIGVLVILVAGITMVGRIGESPKGIFLNKKTNAVQPPLKTDTENEFKKTWEEEEKRQVLNYIKNQK